MQSITKYPDLPRGAVLRVDPRAVGDLDLHAAKGEWYVALSQRQFDARNDALKNLGVPIGDAMWPENCAGVLTPYSPATLHKGCPSENQLVASIGIPRDEMINGKHLSMVRVLIATKGPHGMSLVTFDCTLEASSSGWLVTRGPALSFIE
ncbi:MAG: hypothetical protein ABJE47_07470 [bacterium]